VNGLSNKTLLRFNCECGFCESIGVGYLSGVVIRGDITLICPACLAILALTNVSVVTPITKIAPHDRPKGSAT